LKILSMTCDCKKKNRKVTYPLIDAYHSHV